MGVIQAGVAFLAWLPSRLLAVDAYICVKVDPYIKPVYNELEAIATSLLLVLARAGFSSYEYRNNFYFLQKIQRP